MAYTEWAWGAQPDEWIEDGWFDAEGNWHEGSELGGLRKNEGNVADWDDPENVAF